MALKFVTDFYDGRLLRERREHGLVHEVEARGCGCQPVPVHFRRHVGQESTSSNAILQTMAQSQATGVAFRSSTKFC